MKAIQALSSTNLGALCAALALAGASPAAGASPLWPSNALPPLAVSSRWESSDEDVPHINFVFQGNGIELLFGALRPFAVPAPTDSRPDVPGALVFRDARVPDAYLCFTMFGSGDFLPSVSASNLQSYLDALIENCDPAKGQSLEVLEAPSEIPRKELFIGMRPLYLCWHYRDLPHDIDIVRSDYFFELSGGRLLVVSVVTNPAGHEGVRAAAIEVLRSGSIVQ